MNAKLTMTIGHGGRRSVMKQNIHPKTRLVIFEDSQTKKQYLINSSVNTKETAVFEADGKEYPVYKVDVSADSHPFYTGAQTFVQKAGQVDKFNKRFAAKVSPKAEEQTETTQEEN